MNFHKATHSRQQPDANYPLIRDVRRCAFSTILGVAITAATLLVLVIGYFLARRRRAFPAYGWLGWVALVSAEVLMFAHDRAGG